MVRRLSVNYWRGDKLATATMYEGVGLAAKSLHLVGRADQGVLPLIRERCRVLAFLHICS